MIDTKEFHAIYALSKNLRVFEVGVIGVLKTLFCALPLVCNNTASVLSILARYLFITQTTF